VIELIKIRIDIRLSYQAVAVVVRNDIGWRSCWNRGELTTRVVRVAARVSNTFELSCLLPAVREVTWNFVDTRVILMHVSMRVVHAQSRRCTSNSFDSAEVFVRARRLRDRLSTCSRTLANATILHSEKNLKNTGHSHAVGVYAADRRRHPAHFGTCTLLNNCIYSCCTDPGPGTRQVYKCKILCNNYGERMQQKNGTNQW
jgi:hypothetical protein